MFVPPQRRYDNGCTVPTLFFQTLDHAAKHFNRYTLANVFNDVVRVCILSGIPLGGEFPISSTMVVPLGPHIIFNMPGSCSGHMFFLCSVECDEELRVYGFGTEAKDLAKAKRPFFIINKQQRLDTMTTSVVDVSASFPVRKIFTNLFIEIHNFDRHCEPLSLLFSSHARLKFWRLLCCVTLPTKRNEPMFTLERFPDV